MRPRKAGKQIIRGRVYGRFWFGGEARESIPLPGVTGAGPDAIDKRCAVVADAIARLVEAGREDRARDMAIQLGLAKNQRAVDAVLKTVKGIVEKSGPIGANVTVKKFGDQWVSGELARAYPDHIETKRSAKDDKQILGQYVYPIIGSTPVRSVEIDDAKRVMAGIRGGLSRARRRHVAQAMHRLFAIAVFPVGLITVSPLPPGFLPKLGSETAKQYLYPDEDTKLMRCKCVPLAYRIFYGMLAREGMRFTECHSLGWNDLDLERGAVKLDVNKTDAPRGWALDRGVVATLRRWKEMRPGLASPFADVSDHHPAGRFRDEHLRAAKVERSELYESTDVRKPIRVHDLRATFVTISLANGKTETWVQDRTGHRSTLMIARYRRGARTIEELALGPLLPLDATVDWSEEATTKPLPISCQVAEVPVELVTKGRKNKGGPSGGRTRKPVKAADFKSEARGPGAVPRRENEPETTCGPQAQREATDSLLIGPLGKGLADVDQIRNDWHAIEVAGAAMEATDFDGTEAPPGASRVPS